MAGVLLLAGGSAGAAIVVYKSWRTSSTFTVAASSSNLAYASMGPGIWVALLGAAAAVAAGFLGSNASVHRADQ